MPDFNLDDLEREAIINCLIFTEGNRQNAADLLGVTIRTVRNKLNLYRKNNQLPNDKIFNRYGTYNR